MPTCPSPRRAHCRACFADQTHKSRVESMASNVVSEANSFALQETQVASTHDSIIILDFGSQYSHLIARRIREANVYCELQSCLVDVKYLEKFGSRLKGVIFSGGPHSVYEEGAPHPAEEIFEFLEKKIYTTSWNLLWPPTNGIQRGR